MFCSRFGYCQALTGCESNVDCPEARFCFEGRCLVDGTCGSDTHCGLGSICERSACRVGCRGTDGCALGDVCVSGRCEPGRCEGSPYCELGSFCDEDTSSCGPTDPRFCRPCDPSCEACIQPLFEGDPNARFCGVTCVNDVDCPGGMTCSDTYFGCTPGDGRCEQEGAICVEQRVLGGGFDAFCSDPVTREAIPLRRYCSPSTGVCPDFAP